MPSRDEEILWFLKQLWPKTASFNLSETELLVFAIKKGIFFFSYEHILGQPKEAYWQELSDGYVEKYVWHWFVFTIKHVNTVRLKSKLFSKRKLHKIELMKSCQEADNIFY